MENIVENIQRLSYLNDGQKKAIEQKAFPHKRFSNITFSVMTANEKEVIVQVIQLEHLSENYATAERLVELGKELFQPFLYGRKLKVGAKPFFVAPVDVVTMQWIKDQMAKLTLKATDLEKNLGIDRSTLSQFLNGKRELSRATKAMFYYFFEYKKLAKSEVETEKKEIEVFRIKDLIRGERFIFNDTSFLVTRKYLDDNKPLIAMNEKALVREHFHNEEMVIEKKI